MYIIYIYIYIYIHVYMYIYIIVPAVNASNEAINVGQHKIWVGGVSAGIKTDLGFLGGTKWIFRVLKL